MIKKVFQKPCVRPKSGKNCFIIAGAHSGAGKTTITLGLMSALMKRGVTVQPFKVGPDYIDPSYHKAVCGRPSYNLDTWMMGVDGVKDTFAKIMANAECITSPVSPSFIKRGMGGVAVGVIEGVMGLFDGKDGKDEYGSTAHVAKVLGIPVILVVDARSMARSAGALVYGYERFDPKVKIAAVIFNRVGSERHFKMLKQAVETKCRAKVLGYIPRDEEISLPERHLGLVMAKEQFGVRGSELGVKNKLAKLMERFVNINGILRLNSKFKIPNSRFKIVNRKSEIANVKIAVALDDAFCFYYQENLDILKQLGAEIVFFSPLKDKRLPHDINGIYLGGGYPELFAKKLEANKALRQHIKNLAEKGLPIYAECGGLMYLGKGLKDFKGKKYEMVGVFPWVSRMLEKRKSLGYREIKASEDCLFLAKGQTMRGHEYHYSEIDEPSQKIKRVYRITPHTSRLTASEGYLYNNTLASYIHLHFASNPKFAEGFVKLCGRKKSVNK
ncbi:MAG: cobyrinate a,c-diamide synthase [Deltaproteobacteria bacterium]|nr:cobyrinate a,c-diamide synthase [Deltaproteobacteria bacterium]